MDVLRTNIPFKCRTPDTALQIEFQVYRNESMVVQCVRPFLKYFSNEQTEIVQIFVCTIRENEREIFYSKNILPLRDSL